MTEGGKKVIEILWLYFLRNQKSIYIFQWPAFLVTAETSHKGGVKREDGLAQTNRNYSSCQTASSVVLTTRRKTSIVDNVAAILILTAI